MEIIGEILVKNERITRHFNIGGELFLMIGVYMRHNLLQGCETDVAPKAFGCTNALSNESDRMLSNVDLSNEPMKWREMVAFMPFNSSTSHSSSDSRASATSQLAVVQKRVETGRNGSQGLRAWITHRKGFFWQSI